MRWSASHVCFERETLSCRVGVCSLACPWTISERRRASGTRSAGNISVGYIEGSHGLHLQRAAFGAVRATAENLAEQQLRTLAPVRA